MRKKKSEESGQGMPYCENPSLESFSAVPQSCFDLVNMYGTYEIQRTADTDNVFPRIAHGEAKQDDHAVISKEDIRRIREDEGE